MKKTNTKMTPREIEEYWQDIAIPNNSESLSVQRGWGGAFYSVSGMKPYLPQTGGLQFDGWRFLCSYWENEYYGKRAYINYWKKGRGSREPIYIAKILSDYDGNMHYTYWLYGAKNVSEEFAFALRQFLETIWVR